MKKITDNSLLLAMPPTPSLILNSPLRFVLPTSNEFLEHECYNMGRNHILFLEELIHLSGRIGGQDNIFSEHVLTWVDWTNKHNVYKAIFWFFLENLYDLLVKIGRHDEEYFLIFGIFAVGDGWAEIEEWLNGCLFFKDFSNLIVEIILIQTIYVIPHILDTLIMAVCSYFCDVFRWTIALIDGMDTSESNTFMFLLLLLQLLTNWH